MKPASTDGGPEPLRTLLETISRQVEELEEQLRALYDDAFIDTSGDRSASYWRSVGLVLGLAALYLLWRARRSHVTRRDIDAAKSSLKAKPGNLL